MATPPGYNITCDPGDLYNRRCYVNTASGQKQEIIGYTSDGQPISKAQSSASWIAWVPTLTTLNQDGQAYQPYGEAGLPYDYIFMLPLCCLAMKDGTGFCGAQCGEHCEHDSDCACHPAPPPPQPQKANMTSLHHHLVVRS